MFAPKSRNVFKYVKSRWLIIGSAAITFMAFASGGGGLDTTFGPSGTGSTLINFPNSTLDRATAVRILPSNGGFQVAGFSGEDSNYNSTATIYTATLNSSGVVTGTPVTFAPTDFPNGGINNIALQSDGTILATGDSSNASNQFQGIVARYNASGTRQAIWQRPSTATDQSGGFSDLAPDASGKVALTGEQGDVTVHQISAAVFRLNSNLTVDTGFGNGQGMAKLAIPSTYQAVETDTSGGAGSSVLMGDSTNGYLVVAVAGKDYNTDYSNGPQGRPLTTQIVVEKLNANGSINTSFGSSGTVTPVTLFTTNAAGTTGDNILKQRSNVIATDSSGLIYIGTNYETMHDFGSGPQKVQVPQITRLTAAGAVDTNFGTNGTYSFPADYSFGNDVIAITATASDVFVLTNVKMARLNPSNGTLDGSFDSNSESSETIIGHNSNWAGFAQLDSSNALILGGVNGDCTAIGNCGNQTAAQAASPDTAAVTKVRLITDTTPDAFTFPDHTGTVASSVQTFGPVTITGINAPAPVSVGGGGTPAYSIGCTGAFSTGTQNISNGQTLCVQHTTSATASAVTTSTVSVGGYSTTFKSTNQAADTTPDNLVDFTAQTGVTPNTAATSNTQTISGINAPATVSVDGSSGALVNINGAGFTSGGTISNGQTLQVKMTAAAAPQTAKVASITVGTVTVHFSVTTGDAAVISLSPSSLTFANQPTGTSSASQAITVTNTGTGSATLSVSSVNSSNAAFTQTNNCSTPVAVSGHCTINVTFAPSTTGNYSATLTVASNAVNTANTVSLSGTAVGPQGTVSLTPGSQNFGTQRVGVESAEKDFTLTNTGNATLTISSITSSNSVFRVDRTNCATSIAQGAGCTIAVFFKPTATPATNGTITVLSDGTTSPDTVTVTGSGIAPVVQLTPAGLDFGQKDLNSSTQQTISLKNNGTADLHISTVSNPADANYTVSGCAGSTVTAGNACTITVTFVPTTNGAHNTSFTITSDASPTTNTVNLTGSGATPQTATVDHNSIAFGDQDVGTTSATQKVVLSNNGTKLLTISSIGITGNFAFDSTTTCPTAGGTLNGGSSCILFVKFTPTATGPRTGNMTVNSDASPATTVVSLSGNGTTPPTATLSNSSLTFSTQVGSTSSAQTVTLSNTGTKALSISSISKSGSDYSIDTSAQGACPTGASTLNGGSSCTLSVKFSPQAKGASTGSVTVTSNASPTTSVLSLNGTGTAPVVTLTPSSLDFSQQNLNSTTTKSVTLKNSGDAVMSISSVSTPADSNYTVSNGCAATLAAGASCTLSISFKPTTTGTHGSSFVITTNASPTTNTVNLTGVGTTGPTATLNPSSLTFSANVGTTSAAQSVTLTNNGTQTLSISSIAVTAGHYALASGSGSCPSGASTLAGGASCTLYVTFSPTAAGANNGSVTVSSNATPATSVLTLNGTGTAPATATLSVPSLNFSATRVGTTSATQSVTLSNTGTQPLSISSIAKTGDYQFDAGTTCPTTASTLNGGSSCTLVIKFAPTASGTRNGSVTVNSNATPATSVLTLNGSGTAPVAAINPTSLDFGQQGQNIAASKTVTVNNTGNAPLNVTAISTPNDNNYTTTSACNAALAPGQSCQITVKFTPTTVGTHPGSFQITTDASATPVTINLAGQGLSSKSVVIGSGDNAGKTVILTASQGVVSTLTSIPTPTGAPDSPTYPVGFFKYTVTGLPSTGTPATVTLTFTLPDGVSTNSYMKCNTASPAVCTSFSGASGSGNKLTISIVDNGTGDSNTTQGVIDDPGAPAVTTSKRGGGAMGWGVVLFAIPALLRRRRRGLAA